MHLIMMAPPGGGKGTQASRLKEKYSIPQVETGKILRQAVQDETELGRQAEEYMNAGKLVPDEIMVGIIRRRLVEPDCENGFILDGFPRTLPQAKALEELFEEQNIRLDAVLYLNVPDEKIYQRLGRRRVCPDCGRTYHLDVDPPDEDELCDDCGVQIIQREDDRRSAIEKRLEEYTNKTEPLLEYYDEQNLLVEIDGDQSIDAVTRAITQSLE